jgi:SAM-dependent methyltransferase
MKDNIKYGKSFQRTLNRQGSLESAELMLGYIIQLLQPNSIVDFGCGTGNWLAIAEKNGIDDCIGIDGDYVDRNLLKIEQKCFIAADVRSTINLGRKFDLAISMEVGEHIDSQYVDIYINNLCAHSDVIMFSAAIPGQGGTGHINEQPLSYWVEKFRIRDYEMIDCLRGRFWNDERIAYIYRQNAVLFVKRPNNQFQTVSFPLPVDIIHPELFSLNSSRIISRSYLIMHMRGIYELSQKIKQYLSSNKSE